MVVNCESSSLSEYDLVVLGTQLDGVLPVSNLILLFSFLHLFGSIQKQKNIGCEKNDKSIKFYVGILKQLH